MSKNWTLIVRLLRHQQSLHKTLNTRIPFEWTQLIEECFYLVNLYEICDMGRGGRGAGVYWIMYRSLGCVHTAKWIMNDAIAGNLTGARSSSCHLQYLQPRVWGDTGEDADPNPPNIPPPVLYIHTADVIFGLVSLGVILEEKQPLFTTLWGYKAFIPPRPPDCKTHKSRVEIRIPSQCHISVAGIWASSLQPFWQPTKKYSKQNRSTAIVRRCPKRWFGLGTCRYPTWEMPTLTLPRPPSPPLQWHPLNVVVMDM